MNKEELKNFICKEVRQTLEAKGESSGVTSSDFLLFGSGSVIDSLDLVGVIVRLEEEIAEKMNKQIQIVDESAVITENSPFKTPDSLADHILKKIHEA